MANNFINKIAIKDQDGDYETREIGIDDSHVTFEDNMTLKDKVQNQFASWITVEKATDDDDNEIQRIFLWANKNSADSDGSEITSIDITGGSGYAANIPLEPIETRSITTGDGAAYLTWTDPENTSNIYGGTGVWAGTKILRKADSPITGIDDPEAILVLDSKIKNKYQTSPYIDTIENDVEYYYAFIPYTTKNKIPLNIENCFYPNPVSPGLVLPDPAVINSVKGGDKKIIVNYSLPGTQTKAVIVYKLGSKPLNVSDGTQIQIENGSGSYTINNLTNDLTYFIVIYTFNEKGRTQESNEIQSTPREYSPMPWATATVDEIQAMLDVHYSGGDKVSETWAIGDKRSVELSAMSATGVGESHKAQTVEYVIVDFDIDDLVTAQNSVTKAAITFSQLNCLSSDSPTFAASNNNSEYGYMNSSNTNSGSWSNCARRTWCNNIYYNAIASNVTSDNKNYKFKDLIKQVKKKTSAGNQSTTINTTNDYIWLLSEHEIFGTKSYSVGNEGNAHYKWYQTTSNRNKLPKWNSSSSSCIWWERSPSASNATIFCFVGGNGTANHYYASNANGLAPCGCL